MKDLQAIPPTPRLITSATNEPPIKAPAHAADRAAILAGQRAAAEPVRRVPEGNEGVAAADGEVAACWGELDGHAG